MERCRCGFGMFGADFFDTNYTNFHEKYILSDLSGLQNLKGLSSHLHQHTA